MGQSSYVCAARAALDDARAVENAVTMLKWLQKKETGGQLGMVRAPRGVAHGETTAQWKM